MEPKYSTSGVAGYSIEWSTSATTTPDAVVDIDDTHTSNTSDPLADGNAYYFHIRTVDNGGNWNPNAVHYGPFFIDSSPPTNPTDLQSSTHAISTWSNDDTVDVNWSGADGSISGIDGYSILWDTSPTTIPDAVKDVEESTLADTSSSLADGNAHYFHIRTLDNAGNWNQSAIHLGPFFIDSNNPTNPTSLFSTSHPETSSWTNDSTIVVIWSGASGGASGIAGYSFEWSTSPTTTPDTTVDTTLLTTTSGALADGNNHYFHLRTKDNAGNWADAIHLGPFYIDTSIPTNPTTLESTSHTTSTWSNDNTITVQWDGADGRNHDHRSH